MLLGIPNLLNVQEINGLEIYTFKSEKFMALMVNDESKVLIIATGKYTVREAFVKAMDALKNKEFYLADESIVNLGGDKL